MCTTGKKELALAFRPSTPVSGLGLRRPFRIELTAAWSSVAGSASTGAACPPATARLSNLLLRAAIDCGRSSSFSCGGDAIVYGRVDMCPYTWLCIPLRCWTQGRRSPPGSRGRADERLQEGKAKYTKSVAVAEKCKFWKEKMRRHSIPLVILLTLSIYHLRI